MTVPSNEELAARIAAVEARLDMEAGLRASVDRDVADHGAAIRATHHLVRSLAITQGEHTQTFARHTATLAEHSAILTMHTALHAEHSRAFGVTHDRLDLIIDLLQPGNNN